MITAQLTFEAPQVRLFARYASTAKWEEAQMVPRNGTAYEFLFAGLPEPVEYYVEASGVKSHTYKLDVVDLPGIKHIKVTYHYPSWLGTKDVVEDPGGDLRAVAGTIAELTVTPTVHSATASLKWTMDRTSRSNRTVTARSRRRSPYRRMACFISPPRSRAKASA